MRPWLPSLCIFMCCPVGVVPVRDLLPCGRTSSSDEDLRAPQYEPLEPSSINSTPVLRDDARCTDGRHVQLAEHLQQCKRQRLQCNEADTAINSTSPLPAPPPAPQCRDACGPLPYVADDEQGLACSSAGMSPPRVSLMTAAEVSSSSSSTTPAGVGMLRPYRLPDHLYTSADEAGRESEDETGPEELESLHPMFTSGRLMMRSAGSRVSSTSSSTSEASRCDTPPLIQQAFPSIRAEVERLWLSWLWWVMM